MAQGINAIVRKFEVLLFNNHPDVVDKKLHDAQMSAMAELKKENARKDREIARKDKALADAATMLMLSKKAEAIWGAKES